MNIAENATGRDCLDSRCPGPLNRERTTVPRTGRPKTSVGHFDDFMLEMLEMRGLVEERSRMEQEQYRARRDVDHQIIERLRNGCLSLRYSELQERMESERAA